jgi:hypothetical protein
LRNSFRNFLVLLVRIPVADVMHLPRRCVREGYDIYLKGPITGSGKPNGLWSPAVLRTWASEGRLPTYGALNRSGGRGRSRAVRKSG